MVVMGVVVLSPPPLPHSSRLFIMGQARTDVTLKVNVIMVLESISR